MNETSETLNTESTPGQNVPLDCHVRLGKADNFGNRLALALKVCGVR